MAEKVKDRAARLLSGLNAGSFFHTAAERVVNLFRRAAGRVKGWGEKLWTLLPVSVREKLPWLEGRLGFILTGAALALLVLLVAVVAAGEPAVERPEAVVSGSLPIPPEELFLPEEPDFLPPVILEREQRDVWTTDDAEPYWYNPLEQGEEQWRERVEQVIDDLLERVP
ncbi:MAG: hypothetical protein LBF95_08920 [Treponema sp.]|jgi:hypothetical protein|nr:hypothetical protein [Treponema sp.]